MKRFLFLSLLFFTQTVFSQNEDSIDNARLSQMIQLSEVVVRNKLDVNTFIQRVKNDTTFYKAFRNLRVLSFTSMNDIRMKNKKGEVNRFFAKQDETTCITGLPHNGSFK
jgi:hypothetical protein